MITDHKTGIKGPAEVWVNPTDQLKLRALRKVNARYAEQTGKAYPPDSPLFVNRDMNPWRSTKNNRTVYIGFLWLKENPFPLPLAIFPVQTAN